jgi:hypothetical protein
LEDTAKASETDMTQKLELPDWTFRTLMINMYTALIKTAASIQGQMGKVSRKKEILINYKPKGNSRDL